MVVGCIMQYRQYTPHPIPFFLKPFPVPYTNLGGFNFILCNCSFGELSFQRFWKKKSNVACGSVSTRFDTCVPMSLEFFSCQTPFSWGSTGICSGGFLGVATLPKSVLQKMYHWMIHCSCFLLGCQSVVTQFLACLCCAVCAFSFSTLAMNLGALSEMCCLLCAHKWQCDTRGWQWLRKEAWDVYLIVCSLYLCSKHGEATVVTAQALRFEGVAGRGWGRGHGYRRTSP